MPVDISFSSYDMVFTNWLIMYLSDEESHDFCKNVLQWLREDGFVFVRESCFYPAGDMVTAETSVIELNSESKCHRTCMYACNASNLVPFLQ